LINPKPIDSRISSILSTFDFWINDENLIVSDKNKIKTIDRNKICGI